MNQLKIKQIKQERYNVLVSSILTNKAVVGKGLWEIGLSLKEIRDRELYLFEFRDFKTFLKKKVELGERTAYRCISVTEEFDLRDFLKWGLYKLDIIKREFPQETEVERNKFVRDTTAYVGSRDLPETINRFKTKVGIQTPQKQETELKIIREYSKIEAFLGNLNESLANWLQIARKHPQHEEIAGLVVKAEAISERIKFPSLKGKRGRNWRLE